MKFRMLLTIVISLLFLSTCDKKSGEEANVPPGIETETLLSGYEIIWGMDFLPDGNLIFTEKRGKVYIKNGEVVTEITGFPTVLASGQGGLLDIKCHPDYSANGWLYATYSSSGAGGKGKFNLIRFRITSNKIGNIENLFATDASDEWFGHYGSRIVFDRDKYLFFSVGEGGPGSYGGPNTINNNAQDLSSGWGKIHRIMDDGSIPAGNPVIPPNTGPTSVYSYGHRNPQGLKIHPETGDLWSAEHGPKGGDEINIITPGSNYGWPGFSLGVNYDGTRISTNHTYPGITEPIYTWTPSIGICGIEFITSDRFKEWKGDLLVSGLASRKLYRCTVRNNIITGEEVLLNNYGRVRNVIQAPDGSVYVSVEGPGRIIRIIPQ